MDMCELRSQQGRQRLAGHWVSAEHVGLEELNVTGQCVPGGSTLVQFPGGWSCGVHSLHAVGRIFLLNLCVC